MGACDLSRTMLDRHLPGLQRGKTREMNVKRRYGFRLLSGLVWMLALPVTGLRRRPCRRAPGGWIDVYAFACPTEFVWDDYDRCRVGHRRRPSAHLR